MGQTATVTAVIVHGAGSTGAAARVLLGAPRSSVCVEDRTGDIERVIAALDDALLAHPNCTALVGVSLGAHAVARWAATTSRAIPRICLVLPAWMGAPGASSTATMGAAQAIAAEGIPTTLRRLREDGAHPDVVDLLALAWGEYSDDELARCLLAASTGRGPTSDELARLVRPVAVVGWSKDAFHPESVARDWSSHLPLPSLAVGARPEIRLLRQALASTGAVRRVVSRS